MPLIEDNLVYKLMGYLIRGDPPVFSYGARTCVVGGQRQREVSLECLKLPREINGAPGNILNGVQSVRDTDLLGHIGHELHQPLSPFRRDRAWIEVAFDLDHRGDKKPVHAIFAFALRDDVFETLASFFGGGVGRQTFDCGLGPTYGRWTRNTWLQKQRAQGHEGRRKKSILVCGMRNGKRGMGEGFSGETASAWNDLKR